MKDTLPSMLLSAAIAAVTAALVATLFVPSGVSRTADAPRAFADPLAAPSQAGNEARLRELERRNAELELRLAVLESEAPASARRPPAEGPGEPATPDAPGSETSLALARRTFSVEGPVPGVFVERVQQALDEIRAAEERERETQRLQARDDRIEGRLERLTETLALSAYQVDELRVVLRDQEQRRAELFDSLREGGDPLSMREGMRSLAEDTSEALAKVLSAEQLEAYRSSADGFGFGLGFRGQDEDGREPFLRRGPPR